MNKNDNVKNDIVNEQKILIAKSVKELDNYFKINDIYFEIIPPTDESIKLRPSFNHIVVSYYDCLTQSEAMEIKTHNFTTVKLNDITTGLFFIEFDFIILNWSD